MPENLSLELRKQTGDLHRTVESRPFMVALLAGKLSQDAYCLMLRNLEPLYFALESALNLNLGRPAIGGLNLPNLYRASSLQADLQTLHGNPWQTDLAVLPACAAYCLHLEDLGQSAPDLLVAHAYVRYLGDLSGGQMIQKILAQSWGLSDLRGSPGLHFYDFGEPQSVSQQTKNFRAKLDAMSSNDELAIALVQEAKLAFAMHITLYDELGANHRMPASIQTV